MLRRKVWPVFIISTTLLPVNICFWLSNSGHIWGPKWVTCNRVTHILKPPFWLLFEIFTGVSSLKNPSDAQKSVSLENYNATVEFWGLVADFASVLPNKVTSGQILSNLRYLI